MLEHAPRIEKDMCYDTAWLHCLTLNYNGHKDWRLPTQREYDKSSITISWFEDRLPTPLQWYCQPVRDII
jgi:hypothetical protein